MHSYPPTIEELQKSFIELHPDCTFGMAPGIWGDIPCPKETYASETLEGKCKLKDSYGEEVSLPICSASGYYYNKWVKYITDITKEIYQEAGFQMKEKIMYQYHNSFIMLSWEHNNFNEVIANSLVTKEARLERERKREYDKLIIAQEEEQKRIKEEEKKQRIIDEAKKRDIENKKYEEDLAKAKEWAAKKMQNEINAKLEAENNKKILEEYKTEQNRIKEELAKVQAHFENISQHEDVFGLFDTYENPVSPIYSDISELFAPNDTYIKNQSESFQNNSNDLLEKLVKKISKRKPIPKKIRGEAWKIQFGESTKGACFCCKKELDSFDDWHAGHIIAHAEGGTDTAANLRPVCGSCNHSMGTENMDAFKARCYPN